MVRLFPAALAIGVALGASPPSPARAETLMLADAIRLAEKQSPDVLTAAAEQAIADGELRAARTVAHNPELGAAVGRAYGGGSFLEWEVSVSQTFQLGGKRSNRTRAAEARMRGAWLSRARVRHVVAHQVRRAFHLAVVARERLVAARGAETATDEMRVAAEERYRLGGATQLEVNAAVAVAGRAKSQRLAAERELGQARAELAASVGAPASASYEPAGGVPEYRELALGERELVGRAIARPDVAALAQGRRAAEADVALADALALPDASLGATYGRSAIEDADTVLFGLTLTLPLWNRNQGGRSAARARLERSRIAEASGRREAERQARTAYRSYRLAREAVLAFDRSVVDQLGENLTLARESFRTGKIGLVELNVVRRDLIDTRFAYLDSLAALVEAEFALALAAGDDVGGAP